VSSNVVSARRSSLSRFAASSARVLKVDSMTWLQIKPVYTWVVLCRRQDSVMRGACVHAVQGSDQMARVSSWTYV
jgi:hypothetical protein